jgi:hypothetical protein
MHKPGKSVKTSARIPRRQQVRSIRLDWGACHAAPGATPVHSQEETPYDFIIIRR